MAPGGTEPSPSAPASERKNRRSPPLSADCKRNAHIESFPGDDGRTQRLLYIHAHQSHTRIPKFRRDTGTGLALKGAELRVNRTDAQQQAVAGTLPAFESRALSSREYTAASRAKSHSRSGRLMGKLFRCLWTDDSGQDLVEYSLLLALISIVCVVAIRLLGTQLAEFWEFIRSTLSEV